MNQTGSTAKRESGDDNRRADVEAIGLTGSSDAQATTDPTYVPDRVRERSETTPNAGDDHRWGPDR